MTPKRLADLLDGGQYRHEITKAEAEEAKQNGLVVVFGASDNLMEFRGAIYDEVFPSRVYVLGNTLISEEQIQEDRKVLERYGFDIPQMRRVEAIWNPQEIDASWLIKSEGAETFDIYEDDNLYCRGVVFQL